MLSRTTALFTKKRTVDLHLVTKRTAVGELLSGLFVTTVGNKLSQVDWYQYAPMPRTMVIKRRKFKHLPFRILSRDTNGDLFHVEDQTAAFREAYEVAHYMTPDGTEIDSGGDIGVVVCIGKKKKGKSFNATMTNLFASKEPCFFGIGSKDRHYTIGLDISPPLPVHVDTLNVKHLCFIDVEGHEKRPETMNLIKKIVNELNCVVVLSCLHQINNEDIELCETIFDRSELTQARPLIVALPPSIVEDPEHGDNFKSIKSLHSKVMFHELPLIQKEANKKVRAGMKYMPYRNPTKYMKKAEIEAYTALSERVLKQFEDANCRTYRRRIVDVVADCHDDLTTPAKVKKLMMKLWELGFERGEDCGDSQELKDLSQELLHALDAIVENDDKWKHKLWQLDRARMRKNQEQ